MTVIRELSTPAWAGLLPSFSPCPDGRDSVWVTDTWTARDWTAGVKRASWALFWRFWFSGRWHGRGGHRRPGAGHSCFPGWQFLVLQALTLGVMALWGVRLWVSPRPQLLWPPVCWAVLAFVIYAIIRYRQADIEYVARAELVRILIYAFLFFAILNNLHRQEWMHGHHPDVDCPGGDDCAGGLLAVRGQNRPRLEPPQHLPGRGSGTFIYPNSLRRFWKS